MDRTKEIQYLKNHLDGKSSLSEDELDSYILYDLFLKHPSGVASKDTEKVLQPVYIDKDITDSNIREVAEEFGDIFPALKEYERAKESHVVGKSSDVVLEKTREMLKEVIEFLRTVYKNADTQDERELIKKAYGIIGNIR